jgi:hypothetical protein
MPDPYTPSADPATARLREALGLLADAVTPVARRAASSYLAHLFLPVQDRLAVQDPALHQAVGDAIAFAVDAEIDASLEKARRTSTPEETDGHDPH